ncbi:MAG TPA: response regulator [Patescibacteria group bacterium]
MAPENANVFLAEDDNSWRRIAHQALERDSHQVLVEVSTFEDALEAITKAKEIGINVAIVDGNLTNEDASGTDGRLIANSLRKEIPEIKIVSFSGQPQNYGDVHVSKGDVDNVLNLGKIVTQL